MAVCDPDERGRLDAAAKPGDVALVSDIAALLALEPAAVFVLTPDYLHEGHAVRVLESSVPTFVEKPMATSVEGADRILETAYRTGTRLHIGHNIRHMPVIRAMRDAIQAGRIGQVKAIWGRHFIFAGGDFYFRDCHADRSKTTGMLLPKGAHDIDVIHWLAGGYPTTVAAVGTLSVYGGITDRRDDSVRRMFDGHSPHTWRPTRRRSSSRCSTSRTSRWPTSWSTTAYSPRTGSATSPRTTGATTRSSETEGRLENLGDDDAKIKLWNTRSDAYREEADELFPVPAVEGGHGGADPLLIDEIVRFALVGGATMTSPIAARHSVAAAVAGTTSLRTGGGAVQVPPVRPEVERSFATNQAAEPSR